MVPHRYPAIVFVASRGPRIVPLCFSARVVKQCMSKSVKAQCFIKLWSRKYVTRILMVIRPVDVNHRKYNLLWIDWLLRDFIQSTLLSKCTTTWLPNIWVIFEMEQLRGLLKGKGLPRTGKNKILIQRLGHPIKMFRFQSPSLSWRWVGRSGKWRKGSECQWRPSC